MSTVPPPVVVTPSPVSTFFSDLFHNKTFWISLATLAAGIIGTFVLAPHLTPAPKISLPESAAVKPMAVLILPVSHTGSNIDWDAGAPDATILPLANGSVGIQFPTPGKYSVRGYVARWGQLAHACTQVTVGDSPNPPPVPPPGPPPPPPMDPFTKGLYDAYQQETDPQKLQHVQFMSGIYKAFGSTNVNDPNLKTLQNLFDSLHKALSDPTYGVPPGGLPKVRGYLGNDMNTVIGTTGTVPLDASLRQKAGAEFTKISNALAEMK